MTEGIQQRIGPYRIEGKLGEGGMAEVFLAVEPVSGRQVALKLLPASMAGNPDLIRRFQREFETCRRIDHPNVVKVHDAGRHEGRLWYAMEYLPFPDLQRLLAETGPLPLPRAMRFMCDMAAAFAAFHPMGIIHRDLKPTNLVVGRGDRLIMVDFGLVKDVNVTAMTRTGSMLGTPQYMSPELVKGSGVGAPSDVFQFGLVAYEMLTGAKAFDGENLFEVARAVAQDPLPDPRDLRPEIPDELARLVADCAEKDPDARPPSGAGLLEALEALRPLVDRPSPRDESDSTGLLGRAAALRAHRASRPVTAPPARSTPPVKDGGGGRADTPPASSRSRRSGAHARLAASSGSTPGTDGNGLSASSLSMSLSRAVAEPEKVLRFWGTLAAGLALVAAGALLWQRWSAPPVVRAITVEKGLHSATVRWESSRPYPSVIELEADGAVTRYEGSVTEDGRHELLLPRLVPGRRHSFVIVLPGDNRSLAQRLELDPVELRIVDAHARVEGLVIALESRPAVRLEALATRRETAERLPVSVEEASRHELVLPPSPWPLRSLRFRARRGADEVELDPTDELFRRFERLRSVLELDMSAHLVKAPADPKVLELREDFKVSREPAEQAAAMRRAIATWLEKNDVQRGFPEAVEGLRRLAPLCMDQDLIPFAERHRCHVALMNMVALQVFYDDKGIPLPPFLRQLPSGIFGPSRRSAMPDGSRRFVHAVPPDRATHGAYRRIDVGKWISQYGRGYEFDLVVRKGDGVRRAELDIDVTRLDQDGFIEISLNGSSRLVFDRQANYQGRLHGAADPAAIREGLNRMQVRLRPIPGNFGSMKLFFRSVGLTLWP